MGMNMIMIAIMVTLMGMHSISDLPSSVEPRF